MKLFVEQDKSKGDGYEKPFSGVLNPISYPFKLTVNPCIVSDVTKDPSELIKLEYVMGAEDLDFGTFSFE